MTPNQVTAVRVAASFLAVVLFTYFGNNLIAGAIAVLLIITAVALDAVDGYIARTRNLATPLGAQFDILGDHVVENLFFTFFAVTGLISLWVPILFFVRGSITDFLRGIAFKRGRSGFGKNSMLEMQWSRLLVASRLSRASYAALKCICFCVLGLRIPLERAQSVWLSPSALAWLNAASGIIVPAAVIFSILRAAPVLWEGRLYLSARPKKALHSRAAVGIAQ